MELIKDRSKFTESQTLFLGSVKEVWNHATKLALSAVHHYVDNKDHSWIAELQNTFLEAGGNFAQCFESMVYATTNVKFRQDEDNLESLVTCKTKGNMPDGFGAILSTIESEGLRRYEKKAKTKQRAAGWNNDGQRKPREAKSSGADVTNLKTTDFGKGLIDAAKAADNLTPEQRKQAEKLVEQLNAGMEAIASGEEPEAPAPSSAGSSSLTSMLRAMTSEQSKAMTESIKMLDDIARVKGTESISKTVESFHKTVEGMHAKISEALTALAKVDAEASSDAEDSESEAA